MRIKKDRTKGKENNKKRKKKLIFNYQFEFFFKVIRERKTKEKKIKA